MFLLAIGAAWISSNASANAAPILSQDKEKFFPRAFKSESFYRSWIINLSFGGVALALSATPLPLSTPGWLVPAVLNTYCILLLNFGACALGSRMLRDDWEIPGESLRIAKVVFYSVICLLAFVLAAWVPPGDSKPATEVQIKTSSWLIA
ncbi:MAG: hypothetical protein K8T26_19615 [Lentisphaerae bacterium]|nr:hypothetical protein [Lentisphaerota bacterium]